MKLSRVVLPSLKAASNLINVNYDPTTVSPGICHVGVGNFFRSHLSAYVNDLLNDQSTFEDNKEWGIVGCSVQPSSNKKKELLESQDCLVTMVERDATSAQATVLGSLIGYLPQDETASNKHQPLEDTLMDPKTKIVSLTLTEGGYFLSDGEFDTEDPDVKRDAKDPEKPQTIFGLIAKSLKQRKDAGMQPFTVMSCDNIPHNGEVVESVVSGIAELMYGKEVASWIEENVAFPNSMVDRITPATTDEMRQYVIDSYGIEDTAPVFCEPFRQWVLQDKFSQGRPDWDKLETVSFVPDVAPYELMKIRILNGGHASLCYPAALLDLDYVHDAMEHPSLGPFLDTLEKNEIIPTVPPVPNTVLPDYWKAIATRFSNPTIMDTIVRNCFDGASRQPKFIVPVVRDARAAGNKVDGLALVSAFWCRYCQGKTDSGKTIEPNDPQWDRLHDLALKAQTDPSAWLGMADVYGSVGEDEVFVEAFANALAAVDSKGVEGAMKDYVEKYGN